MEWGYSWIDVFVDGIRVISKFVDFIVDQKCKIIDLLLELTDAGLPIVDDVLDIGWKRIVP